MLKIYSLFLFFDAKNQFTDNMQGKNYSGIWMTKQIFKLNAN